MAEKIKSRGYSITDSDAKTISDHAVRLGYDVSDSAALRNILRWFRVHRTCASGKVDEPGGIKDPECEAVGN